MVGLDEEKDGRGGGMGKAWRLLFFFLGVRGAWSGENYYPQNMPILLGWNFGFLLPNFLVLLDGCRPPLLSFFLA